MKRSTHETLGTLLVLLAIVLAFVYLAKQSPKVERIASGVEVAARWRECGGRSYPEPRIRIEKTRKGNPWADHAAWEIVVDPSDDRLKPTADRRDLVAHEYSHLMIFRELGPEASYDGQAPFEIRYYEVRVCLGLEP